MEPAPATSPSTIFGIRCLRRLNELTSVGRTATSTGGSGDAADARGAGERLSGDEDRSGGDARGREEESEPAADEQETVDPDSMVLTVEESQATWADLAHPSRPLDDFAVVLLEIAGDPVETPSGERKAAESLVMVAQQYLDEGNLAGLDVVVDRLDFLEQEGRRPAGSTNELLCKAATPERLGRLVARLASAPAEHMARADQLFKRVGPRAHPALLEVLATSKDRAVRKLVLGILHSSGGVSKEHLLPLLNDPRWYVVRNAVHLAAKSGDPGLSGHLERLLSHPEPACAARWCAAWILSARAVRWAFWSGLCRRGRNRANSSGPRTGAHRQQSTVRAVNCQVASPDFECRSAEEVEAFLLSLADWRRESRRVARQDLEAPGVRDIPPAHAARRAPALAP